jgi:hypothetical protein
MRFDSHFAGDLLCDRLSLLCKLLKINAIGWGGIRTLGFFCPALQINFSGRQRHLALDGILERFLYSAAAGSGTGSSSGIYRQFRDKYLNTV